MANSPQYKAVLSHLEALTGAEDSLLMKFKELSWLPIGAEASANELVTLALNRIVNDVRDYDVFVHMLRDIAGMERMVTTIAGKLAEQKFKGSINRETKSKRVFINTYDLFCGHNIRLRKRPRQAPVSSALLLKVMILEYSSGKFVAYQCEPNGNDGLPLYIFNTADTEG